jgi:hypothetical protein
VIEGVEDAVEQAKAAAGDGVAQVVGGPNLIQQLLERASFASTSCP